MSEAISFVLGLPELQGAIFMCCDKKSQSRCARVCKSWTNPSISYLWKELDSIVPLLQLLGGFVLKRSPRANNARLSFSSVPSAHQWSRFHDYAGLVTRLQISNYAHYNKQGCFTRDDPVYFDEVMLQIIANGQKNPRLLPNVISLVVDASKDLSILPLATLFLGQLRSLELLIDVQPPLLANSEPWDHLSRFFDDSIAMAPELEHFGIKGTPGADSKWSGRNYPHHSKLDEIIRGYLVRLPAPSLRVVKVNSTMFTPKLFELLSQFPRIQSIPNSGRRMYYTPRHLRIASALPDSAFPELKHMFLPSEAHSLTTNLLNLSPIPNKLTSLTIGCRDYATPSVLHDLFIAISQSCPMLSSLEIIACTSRNTVGGRTSTSIEWVDEYRGPARAQRERCLSLDRIFELQWLKRLTLILDFVLPIDDIGLKQALQRRGTPFETLQLSWTPRRLDLDKPRLTFDALSIVAQHCPHIRILSLLILVTPSYRALPDASSFACIEEMNFGLSDMPHSAMQSTATNFCIIFRLKVPDISASLHTGLFDKCQFEVKQVKTTRERHRRWEQMLRIFNSMRGDSNGRVLLHFARSEERVMDPVNGHRILED